MKLLFSSLKIQLLCTIIGSIGATAITLTTLAYRAQVVNLERDARRTVHAAAQSRAEAVMRLLDGQQQRAQRFLTTAVALCAEVTPAGARAWELGCARRAVREFRASERAAGVSLSNRRGRIARSGAAILGDVPIPSPLARLIARDGQTRYTILAENQNTAVRLHFTLGELSALFEQPVGLGTSGEVFLSDSSGTILTPTRFRAATVPGALAAGHSCASGPFERHDVDYRGVGVIQGAVSVSAFAQPLCVDAHVSLQEALAPAADLLGDLIRRTALLCGVGALLGLLAAYRISAPVQRLAASARALEGGDFARPIPMSGPSEIQALARALERMARELGEQMARARRARQDAEHANRAKDDFLAVLSHELRTPLTSTLGWTRLLRHKRFNAQQTDQAIGAIERSAQTQKRLIEDLLDVSRIVAGRLQLDLTMVRVNDAVRAALEELRPAIEEKGIVLDAFFETASVVSADPLRLQQIVTNLVSNSIKFTPAGGRVTVRAREVDHSVALTVTDTGVGIDPEFVPRIFERFQQAHAGPRRAYGGLGLGLSIVQHLVHLHGGTIEATSLGTGLGASFEVRLPLAPADSVRAVPPEGSLQRTAEPAVTLRAVARPQRLDALRVLVVEDDRDTRNIVAALLEDAGAKVDSVASAAEGRQRLHTHPYSVIVSDLAMPGEDGYAFMRAVRTTSATVPAVALTALARPEDATAAYAAGFQAYLTKPIDRDTLIIAIANLTLRKTA
jgi:signal transduction histidine kinase/ActR/RegA family two-component response regulator